MDSYSPITMEPNLAFLQCREVEWVSLKWGKYNHWIPPKKKYFPISHDFPYLSVSKQYYISTHRNLSCPAVSHICSLIFCPDTSIIRVPNSTPIVWGQSAITVQLSIALVIQNMTHNVTTNISHYYAVWDTRHFIRCHSIRLNT